jgi:hypothetical protein
MKGYSMESSKKNPTVGGNQTAGGVVNTDVSILNTTYDERKLFNTLRAQAALRGHIIHRTDPQDGPVTYWAGKWGQVRQFANVEALEKFVQQIGGKP